MKREQLRLFALTQTEEALFPLRRQLAAKLSQWGEFGGVPFEPLTAEDPQTFSCAVGHVMRFVARVRHPDEFGPAPEITDTTPQARAARFPQLLETYNASVETARYQVDLIRDFAVTIGAVAPKADFTPAVIPAPVDLPPATDPTPPVVETITESIAPPAEPTPAPVAQIETAEPDAKAPESDVKPVKKPRRRKAKTPPAE